MTEGVVDELEVIEVEHDELEWSSGALRARDFFFKTKMQTARIGQTGERICVRVRFRARMIHCVRERIRCKMRNRFQQTNLIVAVLFQRRGIDGQRAQQKIVFDQWQRRHRAILTFHRFERDPEIQTRVQAIDRLTICQSESGCAFTKGKAAIAHGFGIHSDGQRGARVTLALVE